MNDRKFFLAFADGRIINMAAIRMIDQVNPSGSRCRIWFDHGHKVELHGNAATDLLRHIGPARSSNLPNG